MGTAKSIARKLFSSYTYGGQVDKSAMEKMMVDTYKILVFLQLLRTRNIGQLPRILGSIVMCLISMGMEK